MSAITWQQDLDRIAEWSRNMKAGKGVVYEGHATGLTHYRYPVLAHRLVEGAELKLCPDPTNKYDENAVGLLFENQQIGWVPKSYNGPVSDALRHGLPLSIVVTKHNRATSNFQNILFIRISIVQSQEQIQMTNSKVNSIVSKNVDLGTSAAFLEAGRIANNQLSSIAGKKLPIMVRAYADTALGRLILANIALLAQEHFRPDDEKLKKLANAMTVSAYQEVLQQFDIEQFIDDLLSNATIKKALKTVDSEG